MTKEQALTEWASLMTEGPYGGQWDRASFDVKRGIVDGFEAACWVFGVYHDGVQVLGAGSYTFTEVRDICNHVRDHLDRCEVEHKRLMDRINDRHRERSNA